MSKKILILTPRFPYPVVGGDRLRIYYFCKELAKKYQLTLLSLCETKEEMSYSIPEDGVFSSVERVYLPSWRSRINCALALPTGTPLQVAYYRSLRYGRLVKKMLDQHDAVVCHLVRTSEYVRYRRHPKILEMTDAISLNYDRVSKLARTAGTKQLIYSIEQKRLKRYERDIVKDFDLSVLVSEVDRNYLFPQDDPLREKLLVCSNGVDISSLPFKGDRRGKTIAFIGNMNSVQNLDAAKWFAQKVMPLLRSQGFTFKVVGRISEEQRNALNRTPSVWATGGVESVGAALGDAIVGVCPMRLGAGVQNKILEYMALGLPVVSSSMGYEGLEARRDEEILVKDTPEEIAACIIELAQSPVQRERLATKARRYIEMNHSWEGMLQPLMHRMSILMEPTIVSDPNARKQPS